MTMTRSHMKHIGVAEGSKVWLTASAGAVSVLGTRTPATALGLRVLPRQ